MSFFTQLKARLTGTKHTTQSPDRVSEIASQTAAKQDRSLRGLQTRLHLAARWRHKVRHIEQLAAKERTKAHRARPRVHFGDIPVDGVRLYAPTRFENSIVDTFTDYDGTALYFRFQSGQIVNADRALRQPTRKRPHVVTNPVIRELVVREVNLNANRK